jgi:UDP-GlcNAc:undecaprenyl-phosphate GlcNAc-1-phosphate transferase
VLAPLANSTSWSPALPPFLLASVVCMAAVPASMVLARRVGAVAEPDHSRHIHPEPTPRLGGIALFAGFAIALAVFGGPVESRWQVVAVCGAITVTMAIDDILNLPWWTKLALEVGAGTAVAALGITISFIALPYGHNLNLVWLAAPVTVVWLVGMQTSINLLDGADGVAAGVVAIVAGVLLLAAINRLEPTAGVQNGVIVLSGALMGCCVGFLVFNVHPARVFMGDSGSHFLGLALGTITVLGVAKVAVALSLLVPLVALGLPIGDTAWAIYRRRRAGVSVAEPDAGHLHHRLLALGLTVRETAMAFYLTTAILGCIGLAIFGHKKVLAVAVVLLTFALVALLYRNQRRPMETPHDDDYVILPGRAAVPTRARHGGEAD